MFDVAPTELLLIGVVALLVIGPKDLPRAMRFVGQWVGRARGVARQFRSGIDTMIRESELAEMEKQWAAENERIMREYPPTPSLPAPDADPYAHPDPYDAAHDPEPVMVAQPEIRDAEPVALAKPDDAAVAAPAKRVRKPKAAVDGEAPAAPKRTRKPKAAAAPASEGGEA